MIRFGLLGCGGIGELHAELIAGMPERAALSAVADSVPEAAARLADRHRVAAESDVRALCSRSDVDAVSICTPNGCHAEAASIALAAGKHVLIEKPIDISLAAVDRLVAAQRASGRVVTVVCQRRFQPAFAFLREAAAAGRLGRLTSGSVQTTFWRPPAYYDSAAWRGTWEVEGGGALITQGSHALDLLLWMMGEPAAVSAFAGRLVHGGVEVEDTLVATIRFASGALGTFSATTAAYPGLTVRMQLCGDAGSAEVADERLRFLHTRDAEPPGAPSDDDGDPTNQAHLAAVPPGPDDVDTALGTQYRDFLDALAEGREPLVTTAEARRLLAVILAAYESARDAGRPVDLT